MTTITKTLRFDAAHMLDNHEGMCRNLHGHTYRVDVSVCRASGGNGGDMVMDFKDLKTIAAEEICGRFDHAFIYCESSETERAMAETAKSGGMKTAPLPFRSTAENLAEHFFGLLSRRIPGVCAVKVWETADSCAEFRP